MTRAAVAVLAIALAAGGCASDSTSSASHRPPAKRPDGARWTVPPAKLKDAINKPVVLAMPATAKTVRAGDCTPGLGTTSRLARALIDDFGLHATYRGRAEIAGEPKAAALFGCEAAWSRSRWRAVKGCDGGIVTFTSMRAMTRSGGGLRSCTLRRQKVLGVWVAPPRGAKWLLALREGYVMAYPVTPSLPVRMTFTSPKLDQRQRGRFRFDSVTRAGHLTRHTVDAGIAG
jgi:hypothetical protein